MNWKREAENDLRQYIRRRSSLDRMMERVQALQYQREAIKATSDSVPVQGGCSSWEDKQLNLICEQERLKLNHVATRILVEGTERGLEALDEIERKVLDRFYINHIKNHVESLMEELNYEQRQIYNIKDRALYKFTISQFGIVDF